MAFEHQRRLLDHRLAKVQFVQPCLAHGVEGIDDRDHVEVAAARRTVQRLVQQAIDQRLVHRLVGVKLADLSVAGHEAGEFFGGYGNSGGQRKRPVSAERSGLKQQKRGFF